MPQAPRSGWETPGMSGGLKFTKGMGDPPGEEKRRAGLDVGGLAIRKLTHAERYWCTETGVSNVAFSAWKSALGPSPAYGS
ncbi:hypothetical protein [Pyrobaculum ferrireducens]|uniref:Uncharacterized protein n=1 Tax=Pyrobaculum ferrireducens TaxID=1104324 RepID=G7VFU0_9CREN|nr:hypothetical protein [Pyrobaculum ferrireducens]AET31747.1 hypothetical protein P186_0289 [Pyrobaculum ferrireducens]